MYFHVDSALVFTDSSILDLRCRNIAQSTQDRPPLRKYQNLDVRICLGDNNSAHIRLTPYSCSCPFFIECRNSFHDERGVQECSSTYL